MSDDLISRKALLDIFSKNSIFEHITNAEGKNVIEIIKEQPTAYDTDKVIDEIRKFEICGKCMNNHNSISTCATFCDVGKKLEIVKSVGVADE